MPRERGHTAAFEVADNVLTNALSFHAVEILWASQLKAAEVETEQGGIVAADALDVAAVRVSYPTDAVGRIVVMAEHDSSLNPHLFERRQKVFRLWGAGHSYRLRCAAGLLMFCTIGTLGEKKARAERENSK